MKMKKSIISFTLILCLAVCFMAMPMSAYAAGNGRAIQSGTACVADGNALYYGGGKQWRVLDADSTNTGASGMFLLSEEMLASSFQFEAAWNSDDGDGQTKPNDWQNSDAQKWCQNYLAANFTASEQAAVLSVSKNDAEVTLYSIPWGTSSLSGERLFFLSAQEAATYLGNFDGASGLQSSSYWWLRSPDAHYDFRAGVVDPGGYVFANYVGYIFSARPAFNLNLNSVLFTSAAVGGKSSGAVGAGAISEISAYSGTDWKVTLFDGSRSGFTAETTANNAGVLTIEYSGAATGQNEYISAIIADGSTYTHYGRLAASSGSGSVTIDLSGINTGGKTLYIFNEQYNGDYKTDLSSSLIGVKIPASTNVNNPYGVPSTGSHRDTGLMITLALLSGAVLLFSLRRKREA